MTAYFAKPAPRRTARWAFVVLGLIWTLLLLKPQPIPNEFIPFLWSKLLAAKALHMVGNAALLVLACLGWSGRSRAVALAVLIVHGPLTELGQYVGNIWFATNRSGLVRDVFIDWFGAGLGYLVWRFVLRTKAESTPAVS